MKEYDGKKLRSLVLVIVLLISTITLVNFVYVEIAQGGQIWCDGWGNVTGDCLITAPDDGVATTYKRGQGVTVTWSDTNSNHSNYYVAVLRYDFTTENYARVYRSALLGNTTASHTWSTNSSTKTGVYWISLVAYNASADYNKVASNNNVTVNIGPGIPGYNAFEGGNESIARNGDEILSSTECSIWPLEYHPTNTVDIVVNATQNWSSSYKYFMWKPQYNGTADGGTYEFGWWSGRVDSAYETIAEVDPNVADYTFDDVVLDRSGLWIIDIREDNPANPNYDVTDADFSTYALRNSTVAGWFWVNASDGITLTLGDDDDEFLYNST
ncbi:MAG: hypothetical protein KAS76_04235, partial [Thermoplasmatales archaeon]|nr:hypothetical protein [Thermoplasmatales archaeon]